MGSKVKLHGYNVAVVCFVLALSWCHPAFVKQTNASGNMEAEVVDAFLQLKFRDTFASGVPLVIEEKLAKKELTHWGSTTDMIRGAEARDRRLGEAVRDFCAKNANDNNVDSIGVLSTRHIVLTDKQRKKLFDTKQNKGGNGWTLFNER